MNRPATDRERGARRKWPQAGERTEGAGDTYASKSARERVARDRDTFG